MTNKTICVDASFVVRLVTSESEDSPFIVLWDQWQTDQYLIVAPTLFYYEITNALHRYVLAGQLQPESAAQNLEDALNLGITLYGDSLLHKRAFTLARSLNLSAAYDSHYLALAEQLKADFYTTDKRLYNAVKDTFSWIHLLN
jgi:predicted nucleic acid-binding protein